MTSARLSLIPAPLTRAARRRRRPHRTSPEALAARAAFEAAASTGWAIGNGGRAEPDPGAAHRDGSMSAEADGPRTSLRTSVEH
ncbi:hypothetical protein M6D93_15000 [Jatrophihabitans telluris]|uniref:Uncharacterized protein n=1 Tax=Jatrophihabitans telluris TaxID=2038343 RepID=A0ABY4QW98_9ACTN|nr:hypothetical protein [Jatrophihabitans telluris]UQX87598.1 hypothetical protein M6D93_15000 [Jatrophihabitans telluris]